MDMENLLVTGGIICLVTAIIGGGMKLFGAVMPNVSSLWRQLILGVVGTILLFVGIGIKENLFTKTQDPVVIPKPTVNLPPKAPPPQTTIDSPCSNNTVDAGGQVSIDCSDQNDSKKKQVPHDQQK